MTNVHSLFSLASPLPRPHEKFCPVLRHEHSPLAGSRHMTAMSIFDQALHIPAERLMFEPPRQAHERVLLPLEAQPATKFFVAATVVTFMAGACATMSGLAFAGRGYETNLALAAGFALAALVPACVAATALRDAARMPPLLAIDAAGLVDRRLGESRIAWVDVEGAELVAATNGIQAVRLTLREPREPRFNPFRFGGLSASWSARRRTRLVALLLLDRRPHTLAHTILALAARHGARVDLDHSIRPLTT